MWTPKTYRSNTKPQEVFAWMAIGIIEPHPPKKKKMSTQNPRNPRSLRKRSLKVVEQTTIKKKNEPVNLVDDDNLELQTTIF